MNMSGAEERFFQSTRGRIVSLLRRRQHTVDELAIELGLTDNGVRVHITSLERDGLVAQGEPRRGVGKPSFTYELTPQAERLFPKAYGLLLQHLLEVLGERFSHATTREALIEVGHRLAATMPAPSGTVEDRIATAITTLDQLGGLAEAMEDENGIFIQGLSCPLALAVEGDSNTCLLAETLLSDITGLPFKQACNHTSPPACRFEVRTTSPEEVTSGT